jgi:hypothetical protein
MLLSSSAVDGVLALRREREDTFTLGRRRESNFTFDKR